MSQPSPPPTLQIDHEEQQKIKELVKKLHRYERICEKAYKKLKSSSKYRLREMRKGFLAYEARKRSEIRCVEDGKVVEENIEEVAACAFEIFMDLKETTDAGEKMGDLVITMPSEYYLLTPMEIVRGVKPNPVHSPFFCTGSMSWPKIKQKKKSRNYYNDSRRQKKRIRYMPVKIN